jgi:hypothetical protein
MTILVKSGSDILYHITNIRAAASVLTKDRFELKPSEGTASEQDIKGGTYYLSCMRSKVGAYMTRNLSSWSAVFVLNGQALNARYQVKPVDFWAGVRDRNDPTQSIFSNEMEDRVFSRDPFITNAHKYVTAVHVMLYEDERYRDALLRIRKAGLVRHFPTFFYADKAGLATLNPAKSIPFKIGPPAKPKDEWKGGYRTIRENSLYRWLALYYSPVGEEPWKTAKALPHQGYRAYQSVGYSDAHSTFEADLHNAKTTPYDNSTREREALDKIVGILRQHKWTPRQFTDYLREKWYPNR